MRDTVLRERDTRPPLGNTGEPSRGAAQRSRHVPLEGSDTVSAVRDTTLADCVTQFAGTASQTSIPVSQLEGIVL